MVNRSNFLKTREGSQLGQTSDITAMTRIARREPVISAEIGDEVVMLHVEKNAYYDTDVIGGVVWRALAAPTTVRDICASLVTRYAVDPETCEQDVLAFVREAYAEGLVVAAPE